MLEEHPHDWGLLTTSDIVLSNSAEGVSQHALNRQPQSSAQGETTAGAGLTDDGAGGASIVELGAAAASGGFAHSDLTTIPPDQEGLHESVPVEGMTTRGAMVVATSAMLPRSAMGRAQYPLLSEVEALWVPVRASVESGEGERERAVSEPTAAAIRAARLFSFLSQETAERTSVVEGTYDERSHQLRLALASARLLAAPTADLTSSGAKRRLGNGAALSLLWASRQLNVQSAVDGESGAFFDFAVQLAPVLLSTSELKASFLCRFFHSLHQFIDSARIAQQDQALSTTAASPSSLRLPISLQHLPVGTMSKLIDVIDQLCGEPPFSSDAKMLQLELAISSGSLPLILRTIRRVLGSDAATSSVPGLAVTARLKDCIITHLYHDTLDHVFVGGECEPHAPRTLTLPFKASAETLVVMKTAPGNLMTTLDGHLVSIAERGMLRTRLSFTSARALGDEDLGAPRWVFPDGSILFISQKLRHLGVSGSQVGDQLLLVATITDATMQAVRYAVDVHLDTGALARHWGPGRKTVLIAAHEATVRVCVLVEAVAPVNCAAYVCSFLLAGISPSGTADVRPMAIRSTVTLRLTQDTCVQLQRCARSARTRAAMALLFSRTTPALIGGRFSLKSKTQGFTVETWVMPTTDREQQVIFSHGDKDSEQIFIGFSPTATGFEWRVGNRTPSAGQVCASFETVGRVSTLNRWWHIACVFTGATWKLILNGKEMSEAVDKSHTVTGIKNSWCSIGPVFTGFLLELRVWRFARSVAEIARDMGRQLTGQEFGIEALFPLDEGRDRFVVDLSPGRAHAVITADHESRWTSIQSVPLRRAWSAETGIQEFLPVMDMMRGGHECLIATDREGMVLCTAPSAEAFNFYHYKVTAAGGNVEDPRAPASLLVSCSQSDGWLISQTSATIRIPIASSHNAVVLDRERHLLLFCSVRSTSTVPAKQPGSQVIEGHTSFTSWAVLRLLDTPTVLRPTSATALCGAPLVETVLRTLALHSRACLRCLQLQFDDGSRVELPPTPPVALDFSKDAFEEALSLAVSLLPNKERSLVAVGASGSTTDDAFASCITLLCTNVECAKMIDDGSNRLMRTTPEASGAPPQHSVHSAELQSPSKGALHRLLNHTDDEGCGSSAPAQRSAGVWRLVRFAIHPAATAPVAREILSAFIDEALADFGVLPLIIQLSGRVRMVQENTIFIAAVMQLGNLRRVHKILNTSRDLALANALLSEALFIFTQTTSTLTDQASVSLSEPLLNDVLFAVMVVLQLWQELLFAEAVMSETPSSSDTAIADLACRYAVLLLTTCEKMVQRALVVLRRCGKEGGGAAMGVCGYLLHNVVGALLPSFVVAIPLLPSKLLSFLPNNIYSFKELLSAFSETVRSVAQPSSTVSARLTWLTELNNAFAYLTCKAGCRLITSSDVTAPKEAAGFYDELFRGGMQKSGTHRDAAIMNLLQGVSMISRVVADLQKENTVNAAQFSLGGAMADLERTIFAGFCNALLPTAVLLAPTKEALSQVYAHVASLRQWLLLTRQQGQEALEMVRAKAMMLCRFEPCLPVAIQALPVSPQQQYRSSGSRRAPSSSDSSKRWRRMFQSWKVMRELKSMLAVLHSGSSLTQKAAVKIITQFLQSPAVSTSTIERTLQIRSEKGGYRLSGLLMLKRLFDEIRSERATSISIQSMVSKVFVGKHFLDGLIGCPSEMTARIRGTYFAMMEAAVKALHEAQSTRVRRHWAEVAMSMLSVPLNAGDLGKCVPVNPPKVLLSLASILASPKGVIAKRSLGTMSHGLPEIHASAQLSFDRCSSNLSIGASGLTLRGLSGRGCCMGSVLWLNNPRRHSVFYFEVTILELPLHTGTVAVGIAPATFNVARPPGWEPESVALHSDDGMLFIESSNGRQVCSPFRVGDTIGCGLDVQEQEVFWTRNGRATSVRAHGFKHSGFPIIGMDSKGLVAVNFGTRPFMFNVEVEFPFHAASSTGGFKRRLADRAWDAFAAYCLHVATLCGNELRAAPAVENTVLHHSSEAVVGAEGETDLGFCSALSSPPGGVPPRSPPRSPQRMQRDTASDIDTTQRDLVSAVAQCLDEISEELVRCRACDSTMAEDTAVQIESLAGMACLIIQSVGNHSCEKIQKSSGAVVAELFAEYIHGPRSNDAHKATLLEAVLAHSMFLPHSTLSTIFTVQLREAGTLVGSQSIEAVDVLLTIAAAAVSLTTNPFVTKFFHDVNEPCTSRASAITAPTHLSAWAAFNWLYNALRHHPRSSSALEFSQILRNRVLQTLRVSEEERVMAPLNFLPTVIVGLSLVGGMAPFPVAGCTVSVRFERAVVTTELLELLRYDAEEGVADVFDPQSNSRMLVSIGQIDPSLPQPLSTKGDTANADLQAAVVALACRLLSGGARLLEDTLNSSAFSARLARALLTMLGSLTPEQVILLTPLVLSQCSTVSQSRLGRLRDEELVALELLSKVPWHMRTVDLHSTAPVVPAGGRNHRASGHRAAAGKGVGATGSADSTPQRDVTRRATAETVSEGSERAVPEDAHMHMAQELAMRGFSLEMAMIALEETRYDRNAALRLLTDHHDDLISAMAHVEDDGDADDGVEDEDEDEDGMGEDTDDPNNDNDDDHEMIAEPDDPPRRRANENRILGTERVRGHSHPGLEGDAAGVGRDNSSDSASVDGDGEGADDDDDGDSASVSSSFSRPSGGNGSCTICDGLSFKGGLVRLTAPTMVGPLFTIDFWVRPRLLVGRQTLFYQQNTSGAVLSICLQDSKIVFGWVSGLLGGSASAETFVGDLSGKQWLRITCVQDCGDLVIYKNGALRDIASATAAEGLLASELIIGGASEQSDQSSFDGDLRDIRIFDTALTQEQVGSTSSVMFDMPAFSASLVPAVNLVVHLRLDEGRFPIENAVTGPAAVHVDIVEEGTLLWIAAERQTASEITAHAEVDFGFGGESSDLHCTSVPTDPANDKSALWRLMRRLPVDELLSRVVAMQRDLACHYATLLFFSLVSSERDALKSLPSGMDMELADALQLVFDGGDEALVRMVASPKLWESLGALPNGALYLRDCANHILDLLVTPPTSVTYESPHPCKPMTEAPREVHIPRHTEYDIFFDQRCSASHTLITFYADHSLSHVIARCAGASLSPFTIKASRFFFDARVDGNGQQWGYRMTVVCGSRRHIVAATVLQALITCVIQCRQPRTDDVIFSEHVLMQLHRAAAVNTSRCRRLVIQILTRLLGHPTRFPPEAVTVMLHSRFLTVKPQDLRRITEKQFRREAGLHLHSRFVCVMTEFLVTTRDAELVWEAMHQREQEGIKDVDEAVHFASRRSQQKSMYGPEFRRGKERVVIEKRRHPEYLRLEAGSDKTIAMWSESEGVTCVANVTLYGGKWYFEVRLLSPGDVMIGVASTRGSALDAIAHTLGRMNHTWGYNGKQRRSCTAGEVSPLDPTGTRPWQGKDLVGVLVDVDAGCVRYFLNGIDMGVSVSFADPAVDAEDTAAAAGRGNRTRPLHPHGGTSATDRSTGYQPFFMLSTDEGIVVNFGGTHFDLPIPAGALPVDPANLGLGTIIPLNSIRSFVDVAHSLLFGHPMPPFYNDEINPFDTKTQRHGPPHVGLNASEEDVVIQALEVQNNGRSFTTITANCTAITGRWYYEVTLGSQGLMQIGWVTTRHVSDPKRGVGVGDTPESWALDLFRRLRWMGGQAVPVSGGVRRWSVGDIIGCAIDIDNQMLLFSHNGRIVAEGSLFDVCTCGGEVGFIAAVSLRCGNTCTFNFGSSPFKHKPEGYCALGVPDSWNERVDTYYSTLQSSSCIARQTRLSSFTKHSDSALSTAHPVMHPPEALTELVAAIDHIAKLKGRSVQHLDFAVLHASLVRNTPETVQRLDQRRIQDAFEQLLCLNRIAAAVLPLAAVPAHNSSGNFCSTFSSALISCVPILFKDTRDGLVAHVLRETNVRHDHVRLTINRMKAVAERSSRRAVTVSNTVFGQTHRLVAAQSPQIFRTNQRFWSVVFSGEGAEDVGGPFREHLSEICTELMTGVLPIFVRSPNQTHNVGEFRDAWVPSPSATSAQELSMLELVGRLMGGAMRSNEPLNLFFPPMLWRGVLGHPLGERDLDSFDHMCLQCVHQFRDMKAQGVDPDVFNDTFATEVFTTQLSDGTVVELTPGGTDIPVSYERCEEYTELLLHRRLHESAQQILAMRRGLVAVVPELVLALITPAELEVLVCGKSDYTVQELKEHAILEGLSSDDRRVGFLWQALGHATAEQRKLFLKFVSGRERMPVRLRILPMQSIGDPNQTLPRAATCFFALELPDYSSAEIMRDRLFYTIANCVEIDTDFRARPVDDSDEPHIMVGIDDARHEEPEDPGTDHLL